MAEHYARVWFEAGDPRTLEWALAAGAVVPHAEVAALLADPDPARRRIGARALARFDLTDGAVAALVALLDDPEAATQATKPLAGSWAWNYADLEQQWSSADSVKRLRLWRLLSSRGGWDRVRAGLMAAADTAAVVAGQGQADLTIWLQHAAARMWRAPTAEQLADLTRLLAADAIDQGLRSEIEFRIRLPLNPVD